MKKVEKKNTNIIYHYFREELESRRGVEDAGVVVEGVGVEVEDDVGAGLAGGVYKGRVGCSIYGEVEEAEETEEEEEDGD
jgi:hypothetical protein